ncbi:MAG: hypothetical protein DSY91_01645 [Deltaproteobacteria bacterium]|nr:MAG: hypothetical protein DSY91_01645 [Deltaproteobacteria bacterium]
MGIERLCHFIHEETEAWGRLISSDEIRLVEGDPFEGFEEKDPVISLADVKLLPPARPSKIVAIGLNYRDHAEEVKLKLPEEPLIFLKPSTAVIGPGDPIVMPPMSERVDYEGELGVVIGKKAKNVSEDEAEDYIAGYLCFNDVTARDLQYKDKQWTRGKSFDTFAPMGPFLVRGIDPSDLALKTELNGKVVQSTRTSQLIFSVRTLVSFISRIMTLLPGDVIATGTTSGIGPMQPGDTVTVTIEEIGSLTNPVTKG